MSRTLVDSKRSRSKGLVMVLGLAACLLMSPSVARAETPIALQGVLRDASGRLYDYDASGLTIQFYNSSLNPSSYAPSVPVTNLQIRNGAFQLSLVPTSTMLDLMAKNPSGWSVRISGILKSGAPSGTFNVPLSSVPQSKTAEVAAKLTTSDAAGKSAIDAINAANSGKINVKYLGDNNGNGLNFLRSDGTWADPATSGGSGSNPTGPAGGDLLGSSYPAPIIKNGAVTGDKLETISGLTPGDFSKVTVDAHGRVTGGKSLLASDIPNLPGEKITSGKISPSILGNNPSATTYLRGDGTWATPTSTSAPLTGDVSSDAATPTVTKIEDGKVTTSKLDDVASSFGVSGLSGGTWPKITYNAKGRVINGGPLAQSDLPQMTGAAGGNPGIKGAVPAPAATDSANFLRGDGTWATLSSGLPALDGDVKSAGGSSTNYIVADAVTTSKIKDKNVTNSKLADMADLRIKGNVSGGLASPSDLTGAQVTAILSPMAGVAAGGAPGLVPKQNPGDAGKFLKSDGTWGTMSTTLPALTGDVTSDGTSNVTALTTMPNLAAGGYTKVTVDTKGRVTTGGQLTATDIPNIPGEKITTGTIPKEVLATNAPSPTTYLRGDGTWAPISTFSSGDAQAAVVVDTLAGNEHDKAPSVAAVNGGLALKQNLITSSTDLNAGSYTSNKQGGFTLNAFGAAAGNTGELRFNNLANGKYVGFKAPDTIAANKIWTLPAADGSNNMFLKTDGNGNLSWGALSASMPALTGDVSLAAGQTVTTINPSVVDNTKLANMPAGTFKANNGSSSGTAMDLSAADATAMLSVMGGGKKGLVPPQTAGDSSKFLKGDGTWGALSASMPALTGDVSLAAGDTVTAINSGAVTTTKIADGAVTTAKLVDIATSNGSAGFSGGTWPKITYNTKGQVISGGPLLQGDLPLMSPASAGSAGAAGAVPAPGSGQNLSFLRGDGTWQTMASSMPPLTGDVTSTAGSPSATTISNSAVTNAKLANMANNTIKGNVSGSTGAPTDLTATQATAMLNVMAGDTGSGGTKGLVPAPASGDAAKFLKGDGTWSTVVAGLPSGAISSGDLAGSSYPNPTIASSAVTNAKLANMANNTIKGNVSGSTGAPTDLTATQATALLNVMAGDTGSGGTKGLVPAPVSGDAAAGKFLKADGTWSTVTAGLPSGAISAGDLAGSSYPSPTIAANAVTTAKINNAAVTSAKLATGAVDVSSTTVTGTLAAGRFPALTGDVTTTAGSLGTTIAANAVTNAKLDNMPALTIKGNSTAGTTTPSDLSATTVTGMLNTFSTGAKGLAPGPSSAEVTAAKFLRADGTWQNPPTGGSITCPTNFTLVNVGNHAPFCISSTSADNHGGMTGEPDTLIGACKNMSSVATVCTLAQNIIAHNAGIIRLNTDQYSNGTFNGQGAWYLEGISENSVYKYYDTISGQGNFQNRQCPHVTSTGSITRSGCTQPISVFCCR